MASDLRAWLHDKELDRYAEAFAANGVDLDVLAELSEAELTALGVSLGDRKRLARGRGGGARCGGGRRPRRARMGISTGKGVINDIVTEGAPSPDAVGRTPNLAARLQAMGNPDEILIDEPTRDEIGRHFRVEP